MQITNALIEKTIAKCDAHMRAHGGLSYKTRDSYRSNIRRFLHWQRVNWGLVESMTHEKRMESFLSALANDKKRPISFGTQHQYWNAILYFYREFQNKPISNIKPAKAPRHQRIFSLLKNDQLKELFSALPTAPSNINLFGRLLYGTGMRLDEGLSLRVKDILFDQGLIAVQEGKGDKSRLVDMPKTIRDDLEHQLLYARSQFDADRALKRHGVALPNGLERKYPSYSTSWEWYWVFPHFQEGWDPDNQIKRRFHVYDFDVQKVFRETRRKLKLPEYFTPHLLRHHYATHYLKNLLEETRKVGAQFDLYDFCHNALREKLGHISPQTTKVYIHLATGRNKVVDVSPLDIL